MEAVLEVEIQNLNFETRLDGDLVVSLRFGSNLNLMNFDIIQLRSQHHPQFYHQKIAQNTVCLCDNFF